MKRIWLSSPHMSGREESYIKEAFDSNWVAPIGPNVNGFESDISNFLKSDVHVAALISGTAAIHLALKLLGVNRGDIVFIQSFTFSGTANPAAYLGANIIFIDSEPDTWNMCPHALEDALKKYKAKAIIPVHLYGMPANMEAIKFIADRYGVPIIEDAAEAFGSKYKNQHCGTFGNISALSFNGNKIITTSGGGALVSQDKNLVEQAKYLATQARDPAPHYEHSQIGYNYRMSNIVAGIGRGQIEVLDERVKQRRKNNQRYLDFFKSISGVTFQTEPNIEYFSNYWLTTILIEPSYTDGIDRDDVRMELDKENIESRPLWKPMHLQPVFRDTKFIGSGVCENLFKKGLCLPSGSNLVEEDFDRIFEALARIFDPQK
jgi:dTDP-4-amino-4,6-dideoxygalactose transaminase